MIHCVLGFDGQRLDSITQNYHAGNGYRSYNPSLKRFNAPDSWSPFAAGGINPYSYCAGDPINRTDPSGHMSWRAGLGIGLGILGILGAFFTADGSLIAAGSLEAALGSASTASLSAGTSGIVADITGIASVAITNSHPQASSALGWFSFAAGILSMGTALLAGAAGMLRRAGSLSQANAELIGKARAFELHYTEAGTQLLNADNAASVHDIRWQHAYAYIDDPRNFSHYISVYDTYRMTSEDLNCDAMRKVNLFINRFKPSKWTFLSNEREYKDVPYYASDVARYQYEKVSAANGFENVMPRTIVRRFVSNQITRAKVEGKSGAELFDAFFTTPNGKTTQHLMNAFGITAHSVEVERANFYIRINSQESISPP